MKAINLNADIGEGKGADEALVGIIRSANIACGGHAGTVQSMRKTVRLCIQHRVEIGAHPSFPDKENFGRVVMSMTKPMLRASLKAQIAALSRIAQEEGGQMSYVKPHGALYNMAAEDAEMAELVIATIPEGKILLAPAHSVLGGLARENGIKTASEIFADRAYNHDGTLVSRKMAGSMLTKPADAAAQAVKFVKAKAILPKLGDPIPTAIDSVCVHGDTEGAVAIAETVRAELMRAGFRLVGLNEKMMGA